MNAFAHVLKKDCRRLAVPLALWALVKGVAVLLTIDKASRVWEPALPKHPGEAIAPDRSDVTLTLGILCAIVLYWVLTVILAAWVVLEDPPKGTSAFWLTRPFARRQVLAAKFCLLAVIAILPVAMQLVGLAACGAGGPVLLLDAASELLVTGCVTLAAAAFAITAEAFGQFAINTVLILVGTGLVTAAAVIAREHTPHHAYTPTSGTSLAVGVLALATVIAFGLVLRRYWQRYARFVIALVS